MINKYTVGFLGAFFFFVLGTGVVQGATVTQVISQNNQLCSDGIMWQCIIRIQNPQVTVKYHARIRNIDTGAVLACNPSNPVDVLEGDRLRLEFLPHAYTDISWFGAGWTWDSPYGTWRAGASAPPISCPSRDYVSRTWLNTGWYGTVAEDTYVALTVNPPSKSVTGYTGLTCGSAESDGSRTCTANRAGVSQIAFNFAATYGEFYGRFFNHLGRGWNSWYGCHGNNTAMKNFRPSSGGFAGGGTSYYHPSFSGSRWDYRLQVPAKTISCPIRVIPANTPPASPALSVNGACEVGNELAISISATDPDNDRVTYGIDWNNSGVYQWVPASGSYPPGVTQTFGYTYTTPGNKTIRVVAKDVNGSLSSARTSTFTCVIPNTEPEPPTLTAVSACVVGESTTVEMRGVDPDGDAIRFGVDWGSGVIEWVPQHSYVASGSVVTATHTFSDSETINIVVQDERGLLSSTLSESVACVVHHPPSAPVVTADSCIIREPVHIGVRATDEDEGDTIRYGFDWNKDGVVDDWTGYGDSNTSQTIIKTWDTIATESFNVLAEDSTGKQSTTWTETFVDCTARPPQFSVDGQLTTNPGVVAPAATTTVSWNTEYTTSCTVVDNAGVDGTAVDIWTGVSGVHTSSPIIANTIYTLTCTGEDGSTLTETAAVNLVPIFGEF